MAQFAKVHDIEFPFLKDLNNALADKLGAARNPQVFVLDGERVIRYAGRIDDQYGFQTGSGYAKTKVKQPRSGRRARRTAGRQDGQPARRPKRSAA